jgi:hypothetical protein
VASSFQARKCKYMFPKERNISSPAEGVSNFKVRFQSMELVNFTVSLHVYHIYLKLITVFEIYQINFILVTKL